jgi:Ca2+-transporting ATPase
MKVTEAGAPSWHPMTVTEAILAAGSNAECGLSNETAARRLKTNGPNLLFEAREESWLEELDESLREPLHVLSVAVGVVYWVIGALADALTIFAVIVAVSAVEVVNELRAKRAISALSILSAPPASVIRGGQARDVAAAHVVKGDIVLLRRDQFAPPLTNVLIGQRIESRDLPRC